jgi:aspartyl aminopeptidase
LHAINESVTHFHAVNFCKKKLSEQGFTELKEVEQWKLEAGKSYFFTRNNSTICAFIVGRRAAEEGVSMFKIIGCHTDSPVLKLAPVTKMNDRSGYQQLAVQLYGGGLWHTWFDRDLTLAGKIIINQDGKLQSRYWHCKEPLMKVPNLAIHLTDRSGVFEPNKEVHTRPVLATAVVDQLLGDDIEALSEDKYRVDEKHFKTLLNRISNDLDIDRNIIVDFELNAIDSQPACLVGLHKEFVSSPRLDNLGSSLTSLDSIIEVYKTGSLDDAEVSMIMLFDHEEIGS